MKMTSKFPGFAPAYDFSEDSEKKSSGASKDVAAKGRKTGKPADASKDNETEGYGKEDGFTGSKVTLHQHEDGSYHSHSMDVDGKSSKKEHDNLHDATEHMHEHFEEPMTDEHDGDSEGEGDEETEDYPSRKGGMGMSIGSLMS